MHFRLYNYLNKFNLLYEKQFGFRQKYNTIDALVEFTEKLSYGEKSMKFSMFLKKAFDTLDHELLLHKLENYGKRGCLMIGFEIISAIVGNVCSQTPFTLIGRMFRMEFRNVP